MKKSKTALFMSALCAVTMMTAACGSSESDSNESKPTSEWWDVNKEGMEEETTSAESSETETTETMTEENSETEEATETTSEESTGGSSLDNSSDGSSGNSGSPNSEAAEIPEEVAVDIFINGERNVPNGISLLAVTVNGYDDDDLKVGGSDKLDTFIKCTGLQQNGDKLHYNPDDDDDNVFWYGQGYNSKSKDGCVYIEAVPVTESTMKPTDIDPSQREGYYRIRSLYVSAEDISDLEVTFSGIKVGMEKSAVEKRFDNVGNETSGYTYYANKEGAMLLSYNDADVVEEMYLFIDYQDFLKVKYAVQ